MLTDIKLSKAEISKIVQSGGSFGSWLGNLGKKGLTNVAIPLARDTLRRLVSNIASKGMNKFKRKIKGKEAVRVERGITFSSFGSFNGTTFTFLSSKSYCWKRSKKSRKRKYG